MKVICILTLLLGGCYASIPPTVRSIRLFDDHVVHIGEIAELGNARSCDLIISISNQGSTITFPAHYEIRESSITFVALSSFGSRMLLLHRDLNGLAIEKTRFWKLLSPEKFYFALHTWCKTPRVQTTFIDGALVSELTLGSPSAYLHFTGTPITVGFHNQTCNQATKE